MGRRSGALLSAAPVAFTPVDPASSLEGTGCGASLETRNRRGLGAWIEAVASQGRSRYNPHMIVQDLRAVSGPPVGFPIIKWGAR